MRKPSKESARLETATHCPVCGLFLGPRQACPLCGARVYPRISLRVTRWAALLLATAGLFFLYLMSLHREIPVVRIGDVKPTMQFARVRVRGVLTGPVHVAHKEGRTISLRFDIHDGTGALTVIARREQAQDLVDSGTLPVEGEYVDVDGTLGLTSDGNMLLRLLTAAHMRTENGPRRRMRESRLSEVPGLPPGERVVLEGIVTDYRVPRKGSRAPWTLTLTDGEARVPVVYWEEVARSLPLEPAAGLRVRVYGEVSLYRNRIQIRVGRREEGGGNIMVLGEAIVNEETSP